MVIKEVKDGTLSVSFCRYELKECSINSKGDLERLDCLPSRASACLAQLDTVFVASVFILYGS